MCIPEFIVYSYQILVDEHSDCFQVFSDYKQCFSVCVRIMVPEILSVKFPKVKLLVREHVYFLILVNYTILLFKKSIKVHYSIRHVYKTYYFLKPLPAQDNIIFFKIFVNLKDKKQAPHYFKLHFSDRVFIYVFEFPFPLLDMPFSSVAHFFPIEFIISHMFVEVPCLRNRNPPLVMYAANVFSLSIICLCSLFMKPFSMQRFLTFIS